MPSVSCVMPTTARRRWCVPLAIDCFLRQTHNDRELVIVFDGDGTIEDLIPDDPRIRFIKLEGARSLGEKFNECVRRADCEFVALWADDDWHSPIRLSTTFAHAKERGVPIVGTYKMLFHELGVGATWLYDYGRLARKQPNYLVGGTLLFHRSVFGRSQFPDLPHAVDNGFVSDALQREKIPFAVLDRDDLYVAMVHGENTRDTWNPQIPYAPWSGDLHSIMGDDLERFESALRSRR